MLFALLLTAANVVSFKDAASIRSWDAWDDHKAKAAITNVLQREKRCVTWEKLNALDPGLREIGRLPTRTASEIASAGMWSVDCGTLDRDYADWEAYKDILPLLGVKNARLFSGWAKTEQTKGVYDFGWLDPVVRECAERGVKPWMTVGYGNPVWGSDFRLGMRVSQITSDPEAYAAWLRYVEALVGRYADAISTWEVWNEPFHGQGEVYADFFYRTATTIRRVQPSSKILCAALQDFKDYRLVLDRLVAEKALDLCNGLVFHPYQTRPDEAFTAENGGWLKLRTIAKEYSPDLDIVQGECGCPSQLEYAHALDKREWTEYSQAKWQLRTSLIMASEGVPSSCFSMIDLKYTFMLQSFGLLRSNLLKEFVYRRPSWYAMRNVYSLLDDAAKPLGLTRRQVGGHELAEAVFTREGKKLRFYWFGEAIPGSDLAFERIALDLPAGAYVWTDMITGRQFELDDVKDVPLWDSPILITEREGRPAAAVDGTARWPFAILRCYGCGALNSAFLGQVVAAQDRHPGLLDEVWLGGAGSLTGTNTYSYGVTDNVAWRDELRRHGIGVGYQQGPTLNYSGINDCPRPDFSDEAWAVTDDGKAHPSLFCPNSPEAYAENLRVARTIMEGLKPDSYWPDDDMRMNKRGDRICFCDRCIRLFNEEFGGRWTRKSLSDALYGKTPSKQARLDWTEFNRRSLGRFARCFREAADAVHPACRLGAQATSSYACYNGKDFRPILESLSGPGRRAVGIRPSEGFYCDRDMRQVFRKGLYVMNEATRCRDYGFVGQVCYEAENWPHQSALKNPTAQMVECSLALAVGCDSLALYWGADANRETDENSAYYLDVFARWKPFLLAIRSAFAQTVPAGVSEFRGGDEALHRWRHRDDVTEERLIENAVPLACDGGRVSAYWLNAERVKDVTSEDVSAAFARPVLMDVEAFLALQAKFPELGFTKKVALERVSYNSLTARANAFKESFPGGMLAMNVRRAITPKSADVRAFSEITGRPGACGTCVIPTEFGGAVVLFQYFSAHDGNLLWTGPGRKAVLDALDSCVPGGLNVRLLTGGYVVAVHGRADADGRTAGAYLLNAAAGETPSLELAIRRPAGGTWMVRTVDGERPAEVVRTGEDEIVVRIPPMGAWRPTLVYRAAEQPVLRFGFVSDTHLSMPGFSTPYCGDASLWERALVYFRDRDVDAVVHAGDFTDWGLVEQLKLAGDVWRKVFPGNRGRDGRPVEKLFVMGNHDDHGWRFNTARRYLKEQGRTAFESRELLVPANRAAAWREAFGEDYADFWIKSVKGYRFVGCNRLEYPKDCRYIEEHRAELEGARPFFYVQHSAPKGTTGAPKVVGQDAGHSTAALAAFPNAVALSGHTHAPLSDACVFWKGAFASVGAASLRYLMETGKFVDDKGALDPSRQQGLLVSVYADRIVFERRDFSRNAPVGPDWILPLNK